MLTPWNPLLFLNKLPFEELAERVHNYQMKHCEVYQKYCTYFGVTSYSSSDTVPLLPVQAFKEAKILSDEIPHHQLIFESSGTSGMKKSKHYIAHSEIYRASIIRGMRHYYAFNDYVILGYTPGYSDNPNSSLVWMIKELIKEDITGISRFLPLEKNIPIEIIEAVMNADKKLMLFGAAFGLLDIIEHQKKQLPENSVIIETGGMKTHRREISRKDLHQKISEGFGLNPAQVHSEYGMTEMLSQAYCQDGEWFQPVPWLNISVRNPENPSESVPDGTTGIIGILDMANIFSCSFIQTQDLGMKREDGAFKVLGRHDKADLRGCNFLIEEE